MKRFWWGAGLLIVLLILSSLITFSMERIHEPVANLLKQASEASLEEDWEKANALAGEAKARWEQYWQFTAAFADHTPMDELDGLFAELEVYGKEKEMPHFAATCSHLSMLALAMASSHTPNWWNVL